MSDKDNILLEIAEFIENVRYACNVIQTALSSLATAVEERDEDDEEDDEQ